MTKRPIENKNYVEYIQGSLPIIISAPHGGAHEPKNIPNRVNGVFDMDDYTKELTYNILQEFFTQTKCFPHTILMNLSRKKVDANRAINEATSDNHEAISSYKRFHQFIQDAKINVDKKFQKGLYIDIHGQSHEHQHIEFGYLLFNDTLKLKDAQLEKHQEHSSIKTLGKFSDKCFIEQLKGESSISGLMNQNNFKAIPSDDMPYAKCGNYFEGAFNTKTYSSQDNGSISSIQAEFPYVGCRDTKENRQKTAKAFVQSLIEYMEIHFNLDIKN